MNIIMLGGTGFLGKNMQILAAENKQYNWSFVGSEYDLCDKEKTNEVFNKYKPDICIFASAKVGGIGYNKRNPAILINDNLLMGINVLNACKEHNISQVYITSTCCSYPKYCQVPFREEDLWGPPEEETNLPYGFAKKTIIRMSQAYRQQYGLKTTCFVLANLYGMFDHCDLNDSHVVPALIKKFVDAKDNNLSTVECWGTGVATRTFLNGLDAADCIMTAINNNFDHFEPLNVGTDLEISIKDLANLISKLTGFNGDIVFNGEVSDGQPRRLLDTTKLFNLLGWKYKIPFKKGLIKTIEWYRVNHDRIII